MKKSLTISIVAILILNGCATRVGNAGIGAAFGAIGGGLIGAAIGGKKGAAIGAAAGAALGGVAAYALASDSYTQLVSQEATTWQQQTDAKPEIIKASHIVENGQTVQKIDVSKIVISDEKMVFGNHLSDKARNQLIVTQNKSLKAGGSVHVICPASASEMVINEIKNTGVSYNQDNTLNKGYVIVLSRGNNAYQSI